MRSTSLLLSLSLLCLFAASGWCQETETAAQDAAAASPPADTQDAKAEDATDDQDAEEDSTPAQIDNSLFGGLRVRSIGPALMSGRIGDLAVNPDNFDQIYAAACSGGVWKSENGGITWKPIFDNEGSYSIGCVTLDPHNPSVVWVGTGENNSQRSVSFGDGVYRSRDGGKHWEHMGLKESEHIGMIAVHPEQSDTVFVAAQGPLWRSGGERGLYKTTDGGKTWKRVLHISDDTGVNEVHLDPRDPNVLYASSYQRRRHVWTLINGGPESAIYKSTDGGENWRKLTRGLPGGDKGRIGIDVSPVNPDVIYAIIEASEGGGFYRSTDRGETWSKRSGYVASSPQYYNELVCDPVDVDRVYSLDTFMHVTENGGKSFQRVSRRNRHVDDHALWINPQNNRHMVVGCDGGIYITRDLAENWYFVPNLPITQFYRVSTDNSEPFYYVYGGTQDNNSQGGPSRTTDRAGITNADWFITVGGDGYETQVDPDDPNVVYAQWQYGGLVRHDRRSGETIDIKPREKPGEAPYRWNWDSPLIISPHSGKRLYFAANRLFRSDDGGISWTAISDDLTRQLDRNALEVMGRIQPVDAVAKNDSTSIFGNIVSLSESPLVEGLIYVGTDDGLVQVTEDGGQNWRTISVFPKVPDMAYVSCLTASLHDPDTVYATFDNHKNGDFKPYILKSTDRGQTWEQASGDLPSREVVYSLQEDHIDPQLKFVGTEFGAYFSTDDCETWTKISGLPTVAVRDLDIQRRESDLVLGTFGRSIYILDNYSPLRADNRALIDGADAAILPVKPALRYVQSNRLGGRGGRGSQGAAYYTAANPPYGATITYYMKEKLTTLRERRKKAEADAEKAGKPTPYPTIEELRQEDQEQAPVVKMVIRDQEGNIIRRVSASRSKGVHRLTWNLRYPTSNPVSLSGPGDLPPWMELPSGPLALPGTYSATLEKTVNGETLAMTDPVEFEVVPLDLATFAAEDREAVLNFQRQVAALDRAVMGASRSLGEIENRLKHIRQAIMETPSVDAAWLTEADKLRDRLLKLRTRLSGDRTLRRQNEPVPPSISSRVNNIVGSQWTATSPPTQTEKDAYTYAGEEFTEALGELKAVTSELKELEAKLEKAGAPWTPGRIPDWTIEVP
ncbi:MAG: glycosyl hydrolase [Planctomycetota bacterium]